VDILLILLALFLASFGAGIAGSFLGVGGGVFLIPFMTLVLGVDIRAAIGTSLIGVIGTSTGAASVYVRDHLTNLRLGMFLEVATTLGAITGAFIALLVPQAFLFVLFGVVVFIAGTRMLRTPEQAAPPVPAEAETPVARRLRLGDRYVDARDGEVHDYGVVRPGAGFAVSAVAGGVSGLLGVGGGFLKVPAMNILMRVPMKAAVATSNLMIGVTAAASAFIYYSEGHVDPSLAAMIVFGVFMGTWIGTKLMVKARAQTVRLCFGILLAGIAVFMVLRPFLGVNF
jgi:uncharacterized membrane protein YfcA